MTPACKWFGVTCDADSNVAQILWTDMYLGGYLNFAILTQGLLGLDIGNNQLSGTPNLAALPRGCSRC